MIPKPLKGITASDLTCLVANEIREDKSIEYKRELHRNNDELLKDVSAFANTAGGDLVFGVAESGGLPTEISGLDIKDPDAEIRRIVSVIQTGLRPQLVLSSLDFASVRLESGKSVLVLRIPKSMAAPHQIRETYVFWGRSTGMNYRLDTAELQIAFASTTTIAEQAVAYRAQRISAIKAGEMPEDVEGEAKLILHLIPVCSLSRGEKPDISPGHEMLGRFMPPSGRAWLGSVINLEGRTNYDGRYTPRRSYAQICRSGMVEAVTGLDGDIHPVDVEVPGAKDDQITALVFDSYEKSLFNIVREYVRLLDGLSVRVPIYMLLSLIGVRGCHVLASNEIGEMGTRLVVHCDDLKGHSIDRDDLLLPPVAIDRTDFEPNTALKPLLDMIWNASGRPASPSLDL